MKLLTHTQVLPEDKEKQSIYGKFILVRNQSNSSEQHSLYIGNWKLQKFHREIAGKYGVEYSQVLGGAQYFLENNKLFIFGRSTAYGPIPQEFHESVVKAIKEALEKEGLEVNDIKEELEGED